MSEELKPCPFCGSTPVFTGDVSDWKDDCRYVQLTVECCVSITKGIGWKKARAMNILEREVALRSELTEAWNRRAPDAPECATCTRSEPAAPTDAEPRMWRLGETPEAAPTVVEPVEWRCFHCDEAFLDNDSARLHFGSSEHRQPGCQIDIAEYRRMEETHRRNCEEDTDLHRQIAGMECAHRTALMRAEEEGYAKGLRDAATPPRAALTPEQINEMIERTHFDKRYVKHASDRVCLDWYRMGIRDAEQAHGIGNGAVIAADRGQG